MTLDIRQYAQLARIEVTEEQAEQLHKKIGAILEYVSVISQETYEEFDTKPILVNRFREDKEEYFEGIHEIVQEAPQSKDGYFVVKKIL